MTECEHDLRAPNGAIEIRTALKMVGCRELPAAGQSSFQSLGAYIPGLNKYLPDRVTVAGKVMSAVYPYTIDYALTSIRMQSVKEILSGTCTWAYPQYKHHTTVALPYESGVFMEANVQHSDGNLYVSTTALGACILYSNFRNRSLRIPPVVSILGLPLPETCRNIRQLTVIAFRQAPLDLPTAIHLYDTPVLSASPAIPIRVITLDLDGRQLPVNLYEDLCAGRYTDVSLKDWITNSIAVRDAQQTAQPVSAVKPSTLKDHYSRKSIRHFLNILHQLDASDYYDASFTYLHIPAERMSAVNDTHTSDATTVICIGDIVLLNKDIVPHINTLSQRHRRSRKPGFTFSALKLHLELEKNDLLTRVDPGYNIPYGKFWAVTTRVWDLYVKRKPLELAPVSNNVPLSLRCIRERKDNGIIYEAPVNCG